MFTDGTENYSYHFIQKGQDISNFWKNVLKFESIIGKFDR